MSQWDVLADNLATRGWDYCDQWLPEPVVQALADEAQRLWEDGAFRKAWIGRGAKEQERPQVRGDHIFWWDADGDSRAQQHYAQRLERLLHWLNRELFLNLATYETHYATYPPDTRYQRHFDRFQDAPERTISTAFYLNSDWTEKEGGQLRLHVSPEPIDLLPTRNRLVLFRSADIEHEVLPATRCRFSITGWLRRRLALPVPVTVR
jgi:SM-20-related protein